MTDRQSRKRRSTSKSGAERKARHDGSRPGSADAATSPDSIPKHQRWIDLLAALLARRYPTTIDELRRDVPAYQRAPSADAFERMFERDKQELRAFGVPIETLPMGGDEQVATGYQLRERDFYLPFLSIAGSEAGERRTPSRGGAYSSLPTLTFEPDELSAIGEAAARVVALGDPHLAADVESAMRKLACGLPVHVTHELPNERVIASPVNAKTFAALGAALLDRKVVDFDYHKMGDDTTSGRSVEPYGLVFLGSNWYLIARDRDRGELRHFRLSRMSAVKVNRARELSPDYDIPESFHLAEHARSREAWQLGDGDAVDVTVEFRSTVGAVAAAARLGEPVRGRPKQRRFNVRRGDAFARWLLAFGGDAVPLAPPELVARFREIARETLAVYGEASS